MMDTKEGTTHRNISSAQYKEGETGEKERYVYHVSTFILF